MYTEKFILDNLGEVVILIDKTLEITYSNADTHEHINIIPCLKPGTKLLDCIEPEDKERFSIKLHDARENACKMFYLKSRLKSAGHDDQWFGFSIKTICNSDKEENILIVATPIESLMQEEIDSMEREAALRDAEEMGHTGSWWVDLETRANHWSPGNYRLWNVDPVQGPPPFDELMKKVHPEDAHNIKLAIKQIKLTHDTQSLTFRMMEKGKPTRYFLTRISPWYVNGKLQQVKGLNFEITDLIKIQYELEEKIDELSWQNEKLEKYIFINSHEVRRPMANIMGLIELAKRKNISEDQVIDLLDKEASQMDELIQKINLTLSKDTMMEYAREVSMAKA